MKPSIVISLRTYHGAGFAGLKYSVWPELDLNIKIN
jgi:hypothetical protein